MLKSFKRIIKENIRYFDGARGLARVERKKASRTSDLGWFWEVFKPVFYMLMFYGAITIGFKSAKDIDDILCPYFVWLISGMIPWFYMRDRILGGANSFRKNKLLVTRFQFPVSVIPAIGCYSGIFLHIMILAIGFIICFVFGVFPSIYWLQIPFYFLMMLIVSYIWSLGAGLLASVSGDFLNLLKSINPAFFWLSGILFNSRPLTNLEMFFKLNPISYIVEGYRNSIAYHIWFWEDLRSFGYFALVTLVMLVIALGLYKRLGRKLPDFL